MYYPKGLVHTAEKATWLLPWLTYQQSMIAKLRNEVGEARLCIRHHDWTLSGWWERYVLGIPVSMVLRREITVSAGQHFCWFARTTIPQATFAANAKIFSRLQNETLGEILFSEEGITRQRFTNYLINKDCLEYYWLTSADRAQAETFWLRFSMFTIHGGSPFFLIEILLPGLWQAERGI